MLGWDFQSFDEKEAFLLIQTLAIYHNNFYSYIWVGRLLNKSVLIILLEKMKIFPFGFSSSLHEV